MAYNYEEVYDFELKVMNRSSERAAFFNQKGMLVFAKSGQHTSVTFTGAEIEFVKRARAVACHVHNHPDFDCSFSDADINTMIEVGVWEDRVVSSNFTFIMRKASNYNRKDDKKFSNQEGKSQFSQDYRQIRTRKISQYRKLYQTREIDLNQYNFLVSHETMQELAKNYNMDYKAIPNNEIPRKKLLEPQPGSDAKIYKNPAYTGKQKIGVDEMTADLITPKEYKKALEKVKGFTEAEIDKAMKRFTKEYKKLKGES